MSPTTSGASTNRKGGTRRPATSAHAPRAADATSPRWHLRDRQPLKIQRPRKKPDAGVDPPHPLHGSAPTAEAGPHPTCQFFVAQDASRWHPPAPGEIADEHTFIVAFNPERAQHSFRGTQRAGGPALDALRAGGASRCNVGRVVHPDSGLLGHDIHGISPYDIHHRTASPCGRVRMSLKRVRPSVRVAPYALSFLRWGRSHYSNFTTVESRGVWVSVECARFNAGPQRDSAHEASSFCRVTLKERV